MKTTVEEINLKFTDSELQLINALIQMLLYLLTLIIDIDEDLGFLEQTEIDLLVKNEGMLQKRLAGKSNIHKILKTKSSILKHSNTSLNNGHTTEIYTRNKKGNYELNL